MQHRSRRRRRPGRRNEPAPAPAAAAAVPSLEETLASFSAVSPVEGRLLTDKIAAIKASEEKSVQAMKDLQKQLEEARRRSVDNEVLRQQLLQFQNAMGSGVMQRYGMENIDQVMGELTSRNGDVVGNTASRLIAACNARFMSMQPAPATPATPAAAAAAAEPAAAWGARVTEPCRRRWRRGYGHGHGDVGPAPPALAATY